MAKPLFAYVFLLAIMTFSCANSSRILDDVDAQIPTFNGPPATTFPTLPSGQFPVPVGASDDEVDPPLPEPEAPATVEPPVDVVAIPPVTPPLTVAAPIPIPTTTTTTAGPGGPTPLVPPASSTVGNPAGPVGTPTLSFYMHDILGGTRPSSRVVTGLIARTDINGIPFSQPNNNIFPLQGGTPLTNINNLNSMINPNTAPFLTSLNGAQTSTVLQNTGSNSNNAVSNNNQPFVTAGQLPSSLQKLMFGSITVVDNELTEEHELGSAVVGKAQGFYMASSLDGTSHTMAMTILLHDHDHDHLGDIVDDTISFFGIHRTATPDSQVAVIGGTGKYENAKGYAIVETLPQVDQHTTDGVDTMMHFNIYLSDL